MKKIAIFIITALLSIHNYCWSQEPTPDVSQAVTSLLQQIGNASATSSRLNQIQRLQRKKDADSITKILLTGLKEMKQNKNYNTGLLRHYSNYMIANYPENSFPYFIMAIVSVHDSDFITSNRMLILFDKYSKRDVNDDNRKLIPGKIIELTKEKSLKGFTRLTSEDKKKKFRTEPWNKYQLSLEITPGMLIIIEDNGNSHVLSENNFTLKYKHSFWFNRENSLPNLTRNFGLSFEFGLNVNYNFPNYYALPNYQVYLSPILYLHRFSISPGKIRYLSAFTYTGNYSGENHFNKLAFSFDPEVRLYLGKHANYAANLRMAYKQTTNKYDFQNLYKSPFIYIRSQNIQFSGSKSETEIYSVSRTEYLFGFGGSLGKRRSTNLILEGGMGILNSFNISPMPENLLNVNAVSPYYFICRLNLDFRLM